jgi:hypothetical protein
MTHGESAARGVPWIRRELARYPTRAGRRDVHALLVRNITYALEPYLVPATRQRHAGECGRSTTRDAVDEHRYVLERARDRELGRESARLEAQHQLRLRSGLDLRLCAAEFESGRRRDEVMLARIQQHHSRSDAE